jgi:hypothetical protein
MAISTLSLENRLDIVMELLNGARVIFLKDLSFHVLIIQHENEAINHAEISHYLIKGFKRDHFITLLALGSCIFFKHEMHLGLVICQLEA